MLCIVIIKVLFVSNKKEPLYCNIYLCSPNDVCRRTEVEMCSVKTTPTTNTPIQSVTSKYKYASFLASVSNTFAHNLSLTFSLYSVFASVNSVTDSSGDSFTLGATDCGCGYCCHIVRKVNVSMIPIHS